MSRKKTNQPEYGTELKLAAVRRVLAGESVSAVAQELGIRESGCMCGRTVMQSWGGWPTFPLPKTLNPLLKWLPHPSRFSKGGRHGPQPPH